MLALIVVGTFQHHKISKRRGGDEEDNDEQNGGGYDPLPHLRLLLPLSPLGNQVEILERHCVLFSIDWLN